jgi:hypothetical protein
VTCLKHAQNRVHFADSGDKVLQMAVQMEGYGFSLLSHPHTHYEVLNQYSQIFPVSDENKQFVL